MKTYKVTYLPEEGTVSEFECESPEIAAAIFFMNSPKYRGISVKAGLFKEWNYTVLELAEDNEKVHNLVTKQFPEVLEGDRIVEEEYPESIAEGYFDKFELRADHMITFWILIIMIPIIGLLYLLKYIFGF